MMKRVLAIVLTGITLCFSITVFADVNIHIQTWQTRNGIPVYFVKRDHVPIVDIRVIFHAGSAEDSIHSGLANLVAIALDTGTAQIGEEQIANTFANVGAQYGARVGRDMAVITLRSLAESKDLTSVVDMLHKVLTSASFPQAPWQRLQNQIVVGIKASQEDPGVVAMQRLYTSIYNGHPYAHPVDGNLQSVPVLTREQAISFYHQYYVARNAKLVIVGDLSTVEARHLAANLVGNLSQGEPAKPVSLVTLPSHYEQVHVEIPVQQSTIVLGQIGISVGDPRYFALKLGNYILGASSLGSRLFVAIRREAGLAYGVSSHFYNLFRPGLFVMSTQTRHAQAQQALAKMKSILHDYIKTGPTKTELGNAKKALSGQFLLSLISNSSIASAVTSIAFYNLPLDYLNTYQQQLNAITLTQVEQTLRQVIHPNSMTMVMVGPNE